MTSYRWPPRFASRSSFAPRSPRCAGDLKCRTSRKAKSSVCVHTVHFRISTLLRTHLSYVKNRVLTPRQSHPRSCFLYSLQMYWVLTLDRAEASVMHYFRSPNVSSVLTSIVSTSAYQVSQSEYICVPLILSEYTFPCTKHISISQVSTIIRAPGISSEYIRAPGI